MAFDQLYWHDSILNEICIDRNDPGNSDTIALVIDWQDVGIKKLVFKDVYWANLNMNFGIVAKETIDSGFIAPSDDLDLQNLREKWSKMNTKLELNCYVIKINSTRSEMKIIAKNFTLG